MRRFATAAAIAVCYCCTGLPAQADEPIIDVFPLRNHNPVLQIFGLPAFQSCELAAPGTTEVGISYDIANDADDADRLGEVLVIDAESQVLNISMRRRIGERFEFGVDVPWVRHSGGFLDSAIYNFHNAVGLSNSSRDSGSDQYRLYFARQGQVYFDTDVPTSGLGDVQLSAAMKLGRVTLRGVVKAPTGDPDKLTGSGATDLSVGIYTGRTSRFLDREMSWSGFVGLLLLGDGEVMAELQRDVVPFGGAAARWQATPRFALSAQMSVQAPYFDVSLDELGGTTIQLAVGADYRLRNSFLRLAIVEDIAAGAAPDFALHLSFRSFGG